MYKVFEVILWDCVWMIFHTFFAFLSLVFSNSATCRPEDPGNSSMDRLHSCCLELFIFTPILGKQKFTKPCSVWIKLMITPFPGGHDYKVRWQVWLLTNISPPPLQWLFSQYSKCWVIWCAFCSVSELVLRHEHSADRLMERKHHVWV